MTTNENKRWLINLLISTLKASGKPYPKTSGILVSDDRLDQVIDSLIEESK